MVSKTTLATFAVILTTLYNPTLGQSQASSLASSSAGASSSAQASSSAWSSSFHPIPSYPFSPTACSTDYTPVCTFDRDCYKTFSNECLVKVENCKQNYTKYVIVAKGECESYRCYTPICCDIACTQDVRPVCGRSDQCYRSFSNACFMNVHNCQYPHDNYEYQHDGECTVCEYPKCD